MSDFGITPAGFTLKTLRDILAEVEADQRAEIDPSIDTTPVSPTGQHNGVFARQASSAWETLLKAYDGLDPDKAEDDQLIALCKLTGTVPHGATFSEVTCDCGLNAGTLLETDIAFAHVTGKPDVRFTPKVDFLTPSDGTHAIVFRSENPGPVVANATTLSVIASPMVGWNSISNPLDAKPGALADGSNGDWSGLRTRREAELAAAGAGTPRAIRADILQIEDSNGNRNVQNVLVLNNATDTIDSDGVPPHAIEAIVYDAPTIANDLISQTIFDGLPAGTQAIGQLSGTATDDEGNPFVVFFSRPTGRNVYVTIQLVKGPTYPGDAAFKESLAKALTAAFSVQDDVLVSTIIVAARVVTGVLDVVAVTLGFSPSPVGTSNLAIGKREIAAFDTSRIVVTT